MYGYSLFGIPVKFNHILLLLFLIRYVISLGSIDRGVCLPTIILWVIFVYLEAAIRWKDSRNMPHLDLCRPFAAHW